MRHDTSAADGHALLARDFGKTVCHALGVDFKWVTAIHISMQAGDVVTVAIERLVVQAEGDALAKQLEQYQLVRKGAAAGSEAA